MFLSFAFFLALSFPESRWMWKLQQRKRSKRRKRPQRWMGLSDCDSLMSHQFCTTKVLVRFKKYLWNIYGRFECLIKKDCTPKVDFCSCASSFLLGWWPKCSSAALPVLRRKLKLSQKPRKRRSQKLRSRTQIFWIVFGKQVDTKLWILHRPFAFRTYSRDSLHLSPYDIFSKMF